MAPNKGIFIIEVKGGGLQFKDGQWYSTKKGSNKRPIKPPHYQAKDNAYAVRDKLKEKFPGKKGFGDTLITWGCVFPSQAYNAVGSEFEEKCEMTFFATFITVVFSPLPTLKTSTFLF